MNERERRKNELLQELSQRFQDNATAMRKIAGRIQSAAVKSMELDRRLHAAGHKIDECISGKTSTLPFSYLEFVEFENSQEFHKFRDMPAVSDEDIKNVDFDDLCKRLQA